MIIVRNEELHTESEGQDKEVEEDKNSYAKIGG